MSIQTADIKTYLRINHDKDDDYLLSLIEISKQYIKEQTGVEYVEADKVYRQAVFFMVAHLYDNRSSITEKAVNSVPYTLDALIIHLRLRGAYEEVA
ncbi:MAG: phage gp6-like head-tail connector protein [Clostridia bacterium]|nr:phage gp6-like head-tail connector protein [Clostridia bacterium]